MATIVRNAIEGAIDMDIWAKAVLRQDDIRHQLVEALDRTRLL